MRSVLRIAALAAGAVMLAGTAQADVTVGFVTSLSGPGSSIGIPYGKGIKAAYEYASTVDGQKIKLIELDDGSDPSAATRDAQKLIQEDHVDLLIGTATAPSSIAMAAVANQAKVPMLSISPITAPRTETGERWAVAIQQRPDLMVSVVVDRMKQDGVKTVGYIGFSDAWGDLVYNGLKKAQDTGAVKITANERYARTDTSVTGQILRLVATHPDAVMDGGSGTQGALPLLALADRGYKARLYGTPALLNPDFIRVGGKAAEGILVSAGPVIVAEQLPDSYPTKKIALEFRKDYQKVNGALPTDGFSAYSFDAWLIMLNAAHRTLPHAQPGTPAFRTALKDAIFSTKDLVGTHAVYTFEPGQSYNVDEKHSLVLVRLVDGKWKYVP